MERLIPTVPLRLNYIHWVEDLIGHQGSDKSTLRRGIDIGIYDFQFFFFFFFFNSSLAKHKFHKFYKVNFFVSFSSGYLCVKDAGYRHYCSCLLYLGFSAIYFSQEWIFSTKRSRGITVQNSSETFVFLAFQITVLMSASFGRYFYSGLFGVSTAVPILGYFMMAV